MNFSVQYQTLCLLISFAFTNTDSWILCRPASSHYLNVNTEKRRHFYLVSDVPKVTLHLTYTFHSINLLSRSKVSYLGRTSEVIVRDLKFVFPLGHLCQVVIDELQLDPRLCSLTLHDFVKSLCIRCCAILAIVSLGEERVQRERDNLSVGGSCAVTVNDVCFKQ